MSKYKDAEMATKREMEQYAEIEILKKQNEILMEAVRFYDNACRLNYAVDLNKIVIKARQAIKEVEELNIRKSV